MPFSDFIVYCDESGDHGLVSIDPAYPVLVVTFCVFRKEDYISQVVPAVQKLKFKYWGHDHVVLHNREIRKDMGGFNFLKSKAIKTQFMTEVADLIERMPFKIISSVVDKTRFTPAAIPMRSIYGLALDACINELQKLLRRDVNGDGTTFILTESRGKAEDVALDIEFKRMCGETRGRENLALRFMHKQNNSTGLQLADLICHPVGRHVIKPSQSNRAYDVIESKLTLRHIF